MLVYPNIDPVLLTVGPLSVHWYGVMYLLGFLSAWMLGNVRAQHAEARYLSTTELDDCLFYGVLGVVLGGKVGYWLFYSPITLLERPWELITLWHPGMSFHGGLLGVLIALYAVSWKCRRPFLATTDNMAPLVPLGLFFGRIGNFINGELWGRQTDAWWGMVFPGAGPYPRYPSQLIEALLEGLVLFILLWWYSKSERRLGAISAWFLIGYAVTRSISELLREPDSQYGYLLWNVITMGQILCIPMLLVGVYLLLRKEKRTL